MCLASIDDKFVAPDPAKVQTFWKGFVASPKGKLRFPMFTAKGVDFPTRASLFNVRRGCWLKARSTPIYSSAQQNYYAGFHLLTTEAAARAWGTNPTRVLARGIRVKGEQRNALAYVADEIYVPAEDERIVRNKIVKIVPKKGKKK